MMGSSLGDAILSLSTDSSKLDSGIDSAKSKAEGLSGDFLKIGKQIAGAFAFKEVAAALLKLTDDFDGAVDTIRIGTGATGEELSKLAGSFSKVFATVPTDAGTAASAIADLNTRLGLTGQPLEAMATQFLNLSRITGTELPANIANITRVFGDWSIAAENQSGAMDFLFKTSQQTGIGIEKLSSLVVQFGAPLRQLGFDFETSAALMGKFEQEGVNIETVMGGLKIGLANMAKAGIDGAAGLQVAIEGIKAAGTQAEANAKAIAIFGQRAGPDMAAAIREGRFEVDALLGSLRDSTDGINIAAAATDDWRESLTLIGNAIKVSFAGELDAGFALLGEAAKGLAGFLALMVEGANAFYAFGRAAKAGLGQSTEALDKSIAANKELAARLKIISMESDKASDPKFTNWLKGVSDGSKGAAAGVDGVGKAVAGAGGAADKVRPSFDELMNRIKNTGDESKKAAAEIKAMRDKLDEANRFVLPTSTAELLKMEEATRKDEKAALDLAFAWAGAIPNLDALIASSDQFVVTGQEVAAQLEAIGAGISSVTVPALSEAELAALDVEAAFKKVGVTSDAVANKSLAELKAAVDAAKRAMDAGVGSADQLKRAQEAYAEGLKKAGGAVAGTDLWTKSLKQVSTVLTDLGNDLAGRFSAAIKTGIGPIDDFTKAIIRLVSEQVMGAMIKGLGKLIDSIPGLQKLGDLLKGIGGSSGSSVPTGGGGGGGGGGIPGVGPSGGSGGGGAGSGGSGGDPLGSIAGWISAASNVVQNFQLAKTETTLNAIEEWTRRSMIHLGEGDSSILQWTQSSQAILWIIANNTAAMLTNGVAIASGSTVVLTKAINDGATKEVAATEAGTKVLASIVAGGERTTQRIGETLVVLEDINRSAGRSRDYSEQQVVVLGDISRSAGRIRDQGQEQGPLLQDISRSAGRIRDYTQEFNVVLGDMNIQQGYRLDKANDHLANIGGSIETGNADRHAIRKGIEDLNATVRNIDGSMQSGRARTEGSPSGTGTNFSPPDRLIRDFWGHNTNDNLSNAFPGNPAPPPTLNRRDPNFVPFRGFQSGIDFLPQDTLALLHRGEAVIPAEENRRGAKQPVEIVLRLQSGKEIARQFIADINDLVGRNGERLLASAVRA